MTRPILSYLAVSLVLGGLAASLMIWIGPDVPDARSRAKSWRSSHKLGAIGVGLFVAALWPVLVIGACL